MTAAVQDLVVSLIALGAGAAIVVRARAVLAPKRPGAPCGSCAAGCAAATREPRPVLIVPPLAHTDERRIIRPAVIHANRQS